MAGGQPFSPLTREQAREALLLLLRREPRALGIEQSRWRLADLRTCCAFLAGTSLPGIHGILDAVGIARVRARSHIRSPDAQYIEKREAVAAARAASQASPETVVLLYTDEVTIGRQPTLAPAYGARGDQPRAERSTRADTATRVAAAVNQADGRVVARRASRLTVDQLVAFYQDLVQAYPHAQRLYLVEDNWPVHYHPDVLVALEPQESPYRLYPPTWSTTPSPRAQERYGHLHLPIQLVPLPTYASWLNPIEKLWRLLRQELGHLHPWADRLEDLRAAIDAVLARFAGPSPDLLHAVGLSPT